MSELVPSQWGSVYLFDLCLRFGLSDTALALALHGVEGCKLKEHHLAALPEASGAADDDLCGMFFDRCRCQGWQACSRCCWGFAVDIGVWMKDWDAPLHKAAEPAERAAKTPLVKGILKISSQTEVLPLALSDEAAARLLDIAILCGNKQAAANFAKTFSVRPLRRWRGGELLLGGVLHILPAALWAGADFQKLHLKLPYPHVEVPIPLFLALDCGSEHWQQLGHFFSSKPWWPSHDLQLGDMFVDLGRNKGISMQKIQNGLTSGWNLKHIWLQLNGGFDASLLDLAILCGEPDCANALATAGVQLRGRCLDFFQRACRGEILQLWTPLRRLHVGSALECKSAAVAAASPFLKKSFKLEGAEKGVAVYQMLTKRFHPKGVPLALVHNILAFSTEAPRILDHLDLWDEVRGWMPSLDVKADEDDKAFQTGVKVEEEPALDVAGEPGTLGLC